MKGAIIGDIIGSRFEKRNCKSKQFELFTRESRFTDDTVLTVAVADVLLKNGDYEGILRRYALRYPFAGYGGKFKKWMFGLTNGAYNSWGNGAAMRVSPVGLAFETADRVLEEAAKSAAITHNHPEGIKGAQAMALGIFMAKHGASKTVIKAEIESAFGYDLDRSVDEIRPHYTFDVSSQGSVPEAIIAFLASTDFEDAIRTAVSLGGDSDTIASMTGALAEAFYKEIPDALEAEAFHRLPAKFIRLMEDFQTRFNLNPS